MTSLHLLQKLVKPSITMFLMMMSSTRSIDNLSSDSNILPPTIVRKCERPRQKRIRKEALKWKQKKCDNCMQLSHNKRRCVEQPARSEQAERARDWVDNEIENSKTGGKTGGEIEDSEVEASASPADLQLC